MQFSNDKKFLLQILSKCPSMRIRNEGFLSEISTYIAGIISKVLYGFKQQIMVVGSDIAINNKAS